MKGYPKSHINSKAHLQPSSEVASRPKVPMKRFLTIVCVIIIVLLANLVYYVFAGQHDSVKKLDAGNDLNFYECVSIYQMHTALWLFAWPASPAAANEVFMMQFSGKDVDTVRHTSNFIRKSILSPRVVSTMQSLSPGQKKKIAYNGNISYGLSDPEHKAAMAINPCTISREGDLYFIRLDNSWPKRSTTHIRISKDFEIILHEGLFRYLQDKNIIHHFVDEYCYTSSEVFQ